MQQLHGLPDEQVIIRPKRASGFATALQTSLDAMGRAGFDIIMDSVAGQYFQPGRSGWLRARAVPWLVLSARVTAPAYESLDKGGRHVMFGAAVYTPKGDRGKVAPAIAQRFCILLSPLARGLVCMPRGS